MRSHPIALAPETPTVASIRCRHQKAPLVLPSRSRSAARALAQDNTPKRRRQRTRSHARYHYHDGDASDSDSDYDGSHDAVLPGETSDTEEKQDT